MWYYLLRFIQFQVFRSVWSFLLRPTTFLFLIESSLTMILDEKFEDTAIWPTSVNLASFGLWLRIQYLQNVRVFFHCFHSSLRYDARCSMYISKKYAKVGFKLTTSHEVSHWYKNRLWSLSYHWSICWVILKKTLLGGIWHSGTLFGLQGYHFNLKYRVKVTSVA